MVFAGRDLQCSLQLRNRSAAPLLLAWASAQVHCQCGSNPARVALKPEPHSEQRPVFAFSPTRGQCEPQAAGPVGHHQSTVTLPLTVSPSVPGKESGFECKEMGIYAVLAKSAQDIKGT